MEIIQSRNYDLLQRGGVAIVDLMDWRLDYIAAENSMGFHAPQEAAKILGEATDYARQGQLAARAALADLP